MIFRISMTALSVFALAACSGGTDSADSPADQAPSANGAYAAPAAASEPVQAQIADTALTPQGDCDLLSPEEISAAFGGKLTVIRASGAGARGGSCTYSLAEVPESQIILQSGDEAAYLAKKQSYSSYSGVKLEPMRLGKEAFLVNGAQAIALAEDGQSISLALSMISFGTPAPVTDDEVGAGMSSLAEIALDRL